MQEHYKDGDRSREFAIFGAWHRSEMLVREVVMFDKLEDLLRKFEEITLLFHQ